MPTTQSMNGQLTTQPRVVESTGWRGEHQQLSELIERNFSSPSQQAVNLGVPRHSITAAVLRRFVYDDTYAGFLLPVRFTDGSVAEPFPLGSFGHAVERPSATGLPVLRLGLISFRHPDLDRFVDRYVVTNARMNSCGTSAEQEALSCQTTRDLLSDPVLDDGGIIHFYPTGLEPAVVGFYRGVVETLTRRAEAGRPRTLIVVPRLFDMRLKNAEEGAPQSHPYVETEPWW